MNVMEDPEGPITNRSQISSKLVVPTPAASGVESASWAAKVIKSHNAWRRDEGPPEYTPGELGRALDIAAKALAAQPALAGEVTVVQDDHGNVVAVTRTDSEHRVLSVIWEREQPAPVVGGDARLEKLAYVPGAWRCPKCSLRLIAQTLHMQDGGMSANNQPQACANGCGPMWRVTEREDRQDAQRFANEQSDKLAALSTRPAESVAQGGDEWKALHGMWRALVDAGGATTVARWGAGSRQDEWATAVVAGMLAIERHFHPERFDSFCTGTPTPATGSGGEELARIGELIRTQDNRITDQPQFAVQQKRRIFGIDEDFEEGHMWYDPQAVESYDDAGKNERDAERAADGSSPIKWQRGGYIDVWEFVTACFTEQGCKDYLARDGHNLREPRIYAYGSYRNTEWQTVRNFLKAHPAPAGGDAGES